MTDLQDALDQIKERMKAGGYRTMRIGGEAVANVWPAETWKVCDSQADVPRLVEALEAVHNVVENYPLPHKRDDPTGEIASAIETFGDAIQDAYTNKLAGEDDE